MSLLPTTWALCRLRRVAANIADAAALDACNLNAYPEFVERLQGLRCRFQAAVAGADADAWAGIFVDTWRAFADLPADHSLYLRPLFDHAGLVQFLHHEASIAVSLDKVKMGRGPGILGTGHRVLGGALGVGKTYVLRGLALSLATLCRAATPITLSYEAVGAMSDPSNARAALVPLSVLLDAHALYESAPTEAACESELARLLADLTDVQVPVAASALQGSKLTACGLAPVLLLDEINTWYRASEDPLFLRGAKLVQQLLHFGRRPHGHAVVASSSSCLREQVFAKGSWEGRYPSLNSTLFSLINILPLRDVDRLKAYLAATGARIPPGLSMEQLLALSGGVGRLIDDVLHDVRALRVGDNPVELFLRDEAFAMLATHMLSEAGNAAALDRAGKWPPPVGMDETAAIRLLDRLGFGSDAVRLLQRWRDCNVLFLSPSDEFAASGRIEFLFPYHAVELRALLSADVARYVAHARIQLHGVAGSLEHALEELCRPQLGKLFAGASQRGAALIMRAKVPHMVEAGSADAQLLVPSHLYGQVLRWAAQIGIEDFVLRPDSDDPSIVWIDAWQCKSPAVGTIMRAGCFSASLAGAIASKSLAHAEDAVNYLSNATVKACWGMCALVAILTRAARDTAPSVAVAFRPRNMYLCTTAVLHEDAMAAAAVPVKVEAALIDAFNSSGKSKALGCECPADLAGCTFAWCVRDGVMWTAELLPPGQEGALTSPELRAREIARGRAAQAASGHGASAGAAVGGAGAPK